MAEGGRKRVPAPTVENILIALRGIEWRWKDIGQWLCVPRVTRVEIRSQHSTASECLKAVLLYVLTLHPRASWRCVINALHGVREHQVAEQIQDYCEPVTDPNLTVQSVADVLSMMERNWYDQSPGGGFSLRYHLDVPPSKEYEIRGQHWSQQLTLLSAYVVQFIPGISWEVIAGALYYCCEERALQAAKQYIKKDEDSTLTLPNLLAALQGVTDWYDLGRWLDVHVPRSRFHVMSGKESMLEEWLQNHPSPSWKLVAWALYWSCGLTEHNVLKQLYGKHVTAYTLPIHEKMEACRRAIKEKGAIDQIIMQGIFFGLPRSGKTSTKKRLIGQKPSLEQASTAVAEEVTHVEIEEIEKSTVQLFPQLSWNEVADLSEEAVITVEDITSHFTQKGSSSQSKKLVKKIMKSPATCPTRNIIQKIVRKVKKSLVPKSNVASFPVSASCTESDMQQFSQQESACASSDPMEFLNFSLQQSTIVKHRGRIVQITLYISDAGGQPEFQESLPALVSGPSIYFLTFPLHKGLNEKCPVEYQHPDGRCIVPFQASCTTKEILLSSLASIASTRSYCRLEDGNAVTPKVLFIATHMDKLGSEQDLRKIDQELQDVVKSTTAYKDGMIVFCSEEQMVFAIDNTSDDNKDIQQIRKAVEQLGLVSDDYKISTPYTWMLFAVTLRHIPGRVLSIDDCMKVAKECGITEAKELNEALWFLHHNVGIVRHFQEVPELRDVVIKEPQYIFDKVTELIIQTFMFDNNGPHKHEECVKLGLFPSDMFHKHLTTDSDVLKGDTLAILLKHLHIVAPIEGKGAIVKYFAPAALAHAQLPPETQSEEVIPPIMIVFESGFCPKGMFGALLVDLLQQRKLLQHDCNLKEDRIYRDQICLAIGPYDSFQFSLSPTCIKIALSTTTYHNREVSLGRVCCDVRRGLESSILAITATLHYTQKAAHSLAFACPEPPPHDQSHAAIINFHDEKPCTMTCPMTRNIHYLPDRYLFWFDENMNLPPKASCSTSTDMHDRPSGLPALSSVPEWHRLDLIEGNGKTVRVMKKGAAHWEKIATRLYFTVGDISRIEKDHHQQSESACQTVFKEWLQGNDQLRKPITWNTVIKALKEADLSELAADLEDVLSHS